MRRMKLSLAAFVALSIASTAGAQSLSESLTNGKISGEFAVTYETRKQDKEISSYYQDTAYSVGSFALRYETAAYNNFTLTSKFRVYNVLFEDDENSTTSKGAGDASERFWETNKERNADFEELFITYNADNVDVKMGRQPLNTKWLNKTHDAVNVQIDLDDTDIEMIWTKAFGRVYARDYRPIDEINAKNKRAGLYKFGITHQIDDIQLMGFALTAPSYRDLVGGQIKYDNGTFGASLQHSVTSEKTTTYKDSDHTEIKAFAKYNGFTTTLGHLITGDEDFKHFGMGTTNAFEEGDQLYLKNAKTTYVQVNKSFSDLSLTALYGMTAYDKGTTSYEKDEFTLWAGYNLNKNLKLNIGYTITGEDSNDSATTDLEQFNATLAYKF